MPGRRDSDLLADMIEACRRIDSYTVGADDAALTGEPMRLDAILYNLAVLGEAAKGVSPALRGHYPGVPWSEMARMRDRVIHHYFGLQPRLLVAIVRTDVPHVLDALGGPGG